MKKSVKRGIAMVVVRVYLLPKGYEDYRCDSVTIQPVLGGHNAIINGGNDDGKIIHNVAGAKWLRSKKV